MSRLTKIIPFVLLLLGVLSLYATVHIAVFQTGKLAAFGTALFAVYCFNLAHDVGKHQVNDPIEYSPRRPKHKKPR